MFQFPFMQNSLAPLVIINAVCFYAAILLLLRPSFRKNIFVMLNMPTPSTHMYLKPLDAFRGLAALSIAVFHTWQWSSPAFNSILNLKFAKVITYFDRSVPMFVILSGFLIYRSLKKVSTIEQLHRYALRRALRIFPLYFVTTLTAFMFFRPTINRFIAEAMMFRSIGYESFINPQTWSLYIEVLFYIIAPILVVVFRKNTILWILFGLVVFAFGDSGGSREILLWKYFFFGMLCSELFDRYKVAEKWALLIVGLGAVLLVMDLKFQLFGAGKAFTVGLGVSMCAIIYGTLNSRFVSRLFTFWPFHYLGVISYSIFLWHSFLIITAFPITFNGTGYPVTITPIQPVPSFVLPFILIPALLFWSTISFLFIEKPFLKQRP